jgi:hypothetical protein
MTHIGHFFDSFYGLIPVHFGQLDVHQNQIGEFRADFFQRLPPVASHDDAIALAFQQKRG